MAETLISWLGTPESRILSIRRFRKYIDNLPFEKAVELTKKNWESGPLVNKEQFDIANVEEWPTPWDLFSQPTFCKHAQALGVFYTLLLSDHAKEHDIAFAVIEDVVFGEKPAIIFDNFPLTDMNVSCIMKWNDVKHKLGV